MVETSYKKQETNAGVRRPGSKDTTTCRFRSCMMLLAQMLQYHGTSLSRIKAFVVCIVIHLEVSLIPRLFLIVVRGNEPGDKAMWMSNGHLGEECHILNK